MITLLFPRSIAPLYYLIASRLHFASSLSTTCVHRLSTHYFYISLFFLLLLGSTFFSCIYSCCLTPFFLSYICRPNGHVFHAKKPDFPLQQGNVVTTSWNKKKMRKVIDKVRHDISWNEVVRKYFKDIKQKNGIFFPLTTFHSFEIKAFPL